MVARIHVNQTEYLSGGAGWRARIPKRPPACLAVEPLEARGIMSHSRLPHRQQGTLPSAATVAPYTIRRNGSALRAACDGGS